MNRWSILDNELLDVKEKFNSINKYTQDEIQSIFDEVDLSDNKPISYTKKEKLQRYVNSCKEKGIYSVYVLFMANKIVSKRNIYAKDVLELKLLLVYDNQYKQYDEVNQNAFKTILNSGYNNCLYDIKEKLYTPNLLVLLPLALKKINAGYIYQDYINARIQYDAEQIKKQALINSQQNKVLDINSYEFSKILEIQNKQNLNVNKQDKNIKFSGFTELMSTSLYHIGYLGACEEYNVEEVQFVAVMDDKTTRACKSMDLQVFKLHEMNEYYRYNEEVKDIILTKTQGLSQGINLPPITTTYHPCRSTVVAVKNNKWYNKLGNSNKNSFGGAGKGTQIEIINTDQIKNKIIEYENQIRNMNKEYSIVIDKNNKVIAFEGGKENVIIDIDTTNAIITHNHPRDDFGELHSFGEDDFDFIKSNPNIKELRAVNEEYNYSLKINKTIDIDKNTVWKNGINLKIKESAYNDDEQHYMYKWLRNEGYINYERFNIKTKRKD